MSCSAVNCRNRKSERPELLFFRFPLDADLRRKWVVAMKREKMRGEDKPWQPSKHTRICSLHFRPEDIDHSRIYRKLNRNAIPCIFSWPNKNQQPEEPSTPQELSPIVNKVPKKRQKRYRKKLVRNKTEKPDVSHDELDEFQETVHADLDDIPLCERLSRIEKIIGDIYAPHNQHLDLREETIEDIFIPQNPPTDLKEEKIDDYTPQSQQIDVKEEILDVYVPQNPTTDLKEEIIEDVYLPHNQQIDVKEEIIEDIHVLQNETIIDLKEEIIEDVHVPQNQTTDSNEKVIEVVLMPHNQQINFQEEIIEDVHVPQNQPIDLKEEIIEDVFMPHTQIDLKEEIIEDVYLPFNEQSDSAEEIIEGMCMPQNEQIHWELKAQLELENEKDDHLLQLSENEIDRLKNLVNKNSEVTFCQSRKLKRLNGSRTYFQRKLSAMKRLLEELNAE